MEIMKIQSEEDYKRALDEIWKLWESSSDFERLKLLAAVVHEYEAQNYPM